MEQPITRKSKDTSGHGWLDYWVVYGASVFLIELKHSWNAIKTSSIKETTQNSWTEAIDQLKKIHKEDVANLSLTAHSVAKIALMIVPFYQASKDENKLKNLKYTKEATAEFYNQFLKEIKPAPSWSCLWHLHQDLQETYEYEEQRFELYPCVIMIAKVESVIHKS